MLLFKRHTLLRVAAYSLLVIITVDCDSEPDTGSSGCAGIYGLEGGDPTPPGPRPPFWSSFHPIDGPEVLGGVSGTEVFAGGSNGAMFRFDGSTWSRMSQDGTPADIYGVWAFDQNHVFAVGEGGALIFFDGQKWTAMDVEWGSAGNASDLHDIYSVWGTSPTDVFACGSDRTILHYNGTRWTANRIPGDYGSFASVFGVAPDDVFAVGYNVPEIMHFTGTRWEQMASGTNEYLRDGWAASATDAYAVGANGTVVHFDGVSWTPLEKNFGDCVGSVGNRCVRRRNEQYRPALRWLAVASFCHRTRGVVHQRVGLVELPSLHCRRHRHIRVLRGQIQPSGPDVRRRAPPWQLIETRARGHLGRGNSAVLSWP